MTSLLASLIKNSGAVSDVEITKESMFVIPDLYDVVNPLRAAKKKKNIQSRLCCRICSYPV